MRTIWKFALEAGRTDLKLPAKARLLDVQMQDGLPVAWFLLDPKADLEDRVVHVYGTGWELGDDTDRAVHLGTFQVDGGLVFHAFDVTDLVKEVQS